MTYSVLNQILHRIIFHITNLDTFSWFKFLCKEVLNIFEHSLVMIEEINRLNKKAESGLCKIKLSYILPL